MNTAHTAVARHNNYWLNHGVSTMAVVLVACVELRSSDHGGREFDSEMERPSEERREREGERLKA